MTKKKTFFCFACKETLPLSQRKKTGKTKKGHAWSVCVSCSREYAKQVHKKLVKESWKFGPCPRCLSLNKHDDGEFPLRSNWCHACGFEYTLWLEDPGIGSPLF